MGRELERHALREHPHARLRHAVGRDRAVGPIGRPRPEKHDPATGAAGDHPQAGRVGQVKRAVKVHPQFAGPLIGGERAEVGLRHLGRVGDHDRWGAERPLDVFHPSLHGGCIRHVHLPVGGANFEPRDRGEGRLGLGGRRHIAERYVGASAGEFVRDGPADVTESAADEGDVAVE